jgi:hypothetical protein
MATALALLEEAVEQFAGVDLEGLSGDELHVLIRRLNTVSTRLEAQVVRVGASVGCDLGVGRQRLQSTRGAVCP